ncbi:hypothetical protein MMC07_002383 [Pseudocyphellaria aurata]|nr:hypothetical protein [Pseudocyphellaria aurata]
MASNPQGITFSSSDRVKQLNEIDKDVAQLLHSAGQAIKALTNRSVSERDDRPSQIRSIDQQKEDFTAAASQYFSLLSSVDVRLRRQIYALEEADIIPAEAATKEQLPNVTNPFSPFGSVSHANLPNQPATKQAAASKSAGTGGGLGSLDVGWLNSRNDNVGKEMEAELWGKARNFVMSLEEEKNSKEENFDLLIDNDRSAPKPSGAAVPS